MQPIVHCKFDEMVDVSQLKDHPKNRNKHPDDQLERLGKLYTYHGIRHPIIVSKKSGYIVAGHGRKAAAKRNNIQQMPVVYQDFEDEKAEYAFIQADNAIALWAELDVLSIKDDVKDLGDFDLDMLGLKNLDIDILKEAMADEDEVPEVIEPKSVLGDIYILGEHRLMCGDSTSIDAVEKLMAGEKADMVFTDPPYNLQERGQVKRTNKVESKHQEFGDWDVGFNPLDVLPILEASTQDNAHLFVCTSNYLFGAIHDWFEKIGHKPNYLVWHKKNPMPSLHKSTYVQASELIVHSRKGIPKFDYPQGKNLPNVFSGNVEPHKFGHPSQKPIYVVEYCIGPTKGSVLDLFGGSGSTLIACEKTNRKCFMMELDPHYVDVIVTRYCNYTGKTKVNRNGQEIDWPIKD